MTTKAFEGVKVADFSWYALGPLNTKFLGDHGATVVRIESSIRMDTLRLAGPFKDGLFNMNCSGWFNELNTSKYDMTLDVAKPKGLEVAKRLVTWADIVIENYTPGTMEKWGLGYDELKRIKPDIIMVSASNQGQYGPYAHTPAYGYIATAMAGLHHLTGWPDRDPAGAYGPYTDYFVPGIISTALIAALDYRRRTGKGQYLDFAAVEAGIHALEASILEYTVNGRVQDRAGNRIPYAAPHGAFPCKGDDRWCAIAVFTDEEWANFCTVVSEPWTADSRFSTLLGRKKNEDELERLIGEWTINHSSEDVMSRLQNAGVAAGVVQNTKDIHEDPQLKHRGHFWHLMQAGFGPFAFSGPPMRFSKTACELKPAPCIGEHNEYVLKEILGMSDDEISEVVIAGVLQ
jgi:benzylsuccinate CoA-transferase BbsF subunit